MSESAQCSGKPKVSIPTANLSQFTKDWLLDCELRQHTKETIKNRRFILDKFLWFLQTEKFEACGTAEIRGFLAYLSTAHESNEGRWGNARLKSKARPQTVESYYSVLKTLFGWMVAEGEIPFSPMETIKAPISRSNQIQPFTAEQVKSLLHKAKATKYPRRDTAILLFLCDTGCRASELCGLKIKDLDLSTRCCVVMGKGCKSRKVYFGCQTTKAIQTHLRASKASPNDPLFPGEKGPMTRSGLTQLIRRLGHAAQITEVRCSPHTCRHYFAVSFLKAGGNIFSLQQLLGHTDLKMTRRYVALAEADLEKQGKEFSPMDRLGR
jgi:site-specific recombinase XerD